MASIPNSIKEALLQIELGNAAMVLDLIAHIGYDNSDRLNFGTIWGMVELLQIPIEPSLIRRGLAQLVKHGLVSWRLVHKKTRGRPTIEYRLGSYEGMAKMLGIELKAQENHDAVEASGFRSLRNYRKGLYYTFIKRASGRYSRRWLGARLGVGKRTTWSYEQGTDIQVLQNWDNEELYIFSLKYAPKTKQNDKFFIISWDAEFKEQKVLPYTEFILRRELGLGRRVFKTWQSTNEYKVA